MRVLFLDDMESRTKQARQFFIGTVFDAVETADDAIDMLKKNSPYDLVMLDHDLGGQIFVASDEKSGYHVAQYISTMDDEKLPKDIVIHSHNPYGSRKMHEVLKSAGIKSQIAPFGSEMFTKK